jgi:hypothetical protein
MIGFITLIAVSTIPGTPAELVQNRMLGCSDAFAKLYYTLIYKTLGFHLS